MPTMRGQIQEIWLEDGQIAGAITLEKGALLSAGQYMVGYAPGDGDQPLPVDLFAGGWRHSEPNEILVAPPLPPTWLPGTNLVLRGPQGRGFTPPPVVRRLALLACGTTPSPLLPLARSVLAQGGAVALFSDLPMPSGLPAEIEVYPLEDWPENRSWADFLAMDVPLRDLERTGRRLSLPGDLGRGSAQVLLRTEMPCSGIGECGVCAVRTRAGWKLACKDGPVFDFPDLEW